jgi:hypothetical protein
MLKSDPSLGRPPRLFPVTFDWWKQVSVHLQIPRYVLLELNMASRTVMSMFLSKGILNDAASATVNKHLLQTLRALSQEFLSVSPEFLGLGELGELLERILIVVAICRAKSQVTTLVDCLQVIRIL